MSILRNLGLTALCLMIFLVFNADPVFSKPKNMGGKDKASHKNDFRRGSNGKASTGPVVAHHPS